MLPSHQVAPVKDLLSKVFLKREQSKPLRLFTENITFRLEIVNPAWYQILNDSLFKHTRIILSDRIL